MARDRFIKCKHYDHEHSCTLGRDDTFYVYCQKCDKYDPVKGGIPAKKDLRREKREEEFKRYERTY